MDVWGKVLGLLNKPLNCTSLSLYLFPRELGYATRIIYLKVNSDVYVGQSDASHCRSMRDNPKIGQSVSIQRIFYNKLRTKLHGKCSRRLQEIRNQAKVE